MRSLYVCALLLKCKPKREWKKNLSIGNTSFEELIRVTSRAKSKEGVELNPKLFTGYV